MKRFFLGAFTGIVVAVLLYNPVVLLIYKITEPYYNYPVKAKAGPLAIRSDAKGGGTFGAKRRNGRSHSGVDIQASVGANVYASKSGIAFRGNVPGGYGKYVMIYHPDGSQTFYGHLSEWAISSAQNVRKGQLIGFVGKTGNAASKYIQSHLHFEIRKNGEPQDPSGLMR